MNEMACSFGESTSLIGMLGLPEREDGTRTGAIFLNSGLIHRVGPNRLYVRLARQLGRTGIASLRFDFSGIGDSPARRDSASILHRRLDETREAMNFFERECGVRRFVLIGSCSGAAVAYIAGCSDPRVTALGLLNAQGRAQPRHILRLVLTNRRSWLRFMFGLANYRGLASMTRQWLVPRDRKRGLGTGEIIEGLSDLVGRGADVLMVNCEWDPGYDYFHRALRHRLRAIQGSGRLRLEVIHGADHGYSLMSAQERLIDIVTDWADGWPRGVAGEGSRRGPVQRHAFLGERSG